MKLGGLTTELQCTLACMLGIMLLVLPPFAQAQRSLGQTPVSLPTTSAVPGAATSALSLNGVKTLTLMFRMKPLAEPPVPPKVYSRMPMWRWNFTGGDGYLLVTRNDFGLPFGVLSEMMYFPGEFQPTCSNLTFFSAQRFWVDMKISQQIGRTYWGFPKEMAGFEWTSNSVTAKDLSGKIFFKANLESARPSEALPAWIAARVKYGYPTLQWPIRDAAISIGNLLSVDLKVAESLDDAAEAASEAADAAKAAVAASLMQGTSMALSGAATVADGVENLMSNAAALAPNSQTLSFPQYVALVHAKVTDAWFNSQVFTGRESSTVALAESWDVGFVKGSPGVLPDPKVFLCKKAFSRN